MSRIQLQPAYVLHGRAFRESSQLLEVFTRDFGRIGAVARGARGPKSRWRGILQPFRPLLLSWSHRGDLATLTGADQVAAPPPLAGDALYCGLYMNELMTRLLHRGDPHPELFEHYRAAVGELSAGGALQAVLRVFEKQLLDATGFGMTLDREFDGDVPLRADAWYEYRPGQGAVRVGEDASERRDVVTGQALQALDAGQPAAGDLPRLRHLMRRVIRYHLGDKPLASDALYRGRRPNRDEPDQEYTA